LHARLDTARASRYRTFTPLLLSSSPSREIFKLTFDHCFLINTHKVENTHSSTQLAGLSANSKSRFVDSRPRDLSNTTSQHGRVRYSTRRTVRYIHTQPLVVLLTRTPAPSATPASPLSSGSQGRSETKFTTTSSARHQESTPLSGPQRDASTGAQTKTSSSSNSSTSAPSLPSASS
jgi:hypothetical protein